MNLLTKLMSRFGRGSIAEGNRVSGIGLGSPTVDLTTVERARSEVSIHSAVRIMAHTISQCRWHSNDSRADKFLNAPNRLQTQYEWISSIIHSLMVYGTAPQRVYGVPGKNGMLTMSPMDPYKTKLDFDSMGVPRYLHQRLDGESETLEENEVCYFVDMATYNGSEISRVEVARSRIDSLLAADRNILSCFNNGITASWIVSNEGTVMSEEVTRSFLKTMKQELSNTGGDHTGGVMLLGRGMKIERVPTGSPADSDLRSLRESYIREIAAALGIPPFIVGGAGDTKYNNVSARMTGMYTGTLSPLITNITQKLSKFLEVEVYCDTSELEAGDLRTQIDISNKAVGGKAVWTQNEAREKLGMEPLDEEGTDILGSNAGSWGSGPEQDPGVEPDDEEFPSDSGRDDGPEEL